MKIYVLIICCFFTLSGFIKMMNSDDEGAIGEFIQFILGVIATVFQSIDL